MAIAGMSHFASRLRRASERVLALRRPDGGVGRLASGQSTMPDTADLLVIAATAREPWAKVRPSVEFLMESASKAVQAAQERDAPTDWISSALRGLSSYPQALGMLEAPDSIGKVVAQVASSRVDGGWAETMRGPEISITQTARMIRSLSSMLAQHAFATDLGLPGLSAGDVDVVGDCIRSGLQALLDQRQRATGWRLQADSQGVLSHVATAECLIALDAADRWVNTEEGDRSFEVGIANPEKPEMLTLGAVIYESAWWLARNHDSWVGKLESDPASATEPWNRLTYATAVSAALLGGQNPSGLTLSARHLDSLWIEEAGMWGEWDGNVSRPTVRGTAAAVAAFGSLREALVRQATQGVVDIPRAYEPSAMSESMGTIRLNASSVTLFLGAQTVDVKMSGDLRQVLSCVAEAGAFGVSYEKISMVTTIPSEFLSTYVKRINRSVAAATLFRLDDILVKLPGRKPAVYRLAPWISLERQNEGVG